MQPTQWPSKRHYEYQRMNVKKVISLLSYHQLCKRFLKTIQIIITIKKSLFLSKEDQTDYGIKHLPFNRQQGFLNSLWTLRSCWSWNHKNKWGKLEHFTSFWCLINAQVYTYWNNTICVWSANKSPQCLCKYARDRLKYAIGSGIQRFDTSWHMSNECGAKFQTLSHCVESIHKKSVCNFQL